MSTLLRPAASLEATSLSTLLRPAASLEATPLSTLLRPAASLEATPLSTEVDLAQGDPQTTKKKLVGKNNGNDETPRTW